MQTTNPLAPNVAAEFGCSCKQDANGVWHIGNGLDQADFDEALADLIACGAKLMIGKGNAAYDALQSEGNGRDFN